MIVIPGSATKTGRVKSIIVTGIASVAGTNNVFFYRRSSAPTGGTSSLASGFKHDNANDPPATIVPQTFTVNPTAVGTLVGIGGARSLYWTSGLPAEPVEWDFCEHQDKAAILRGASDFLCIGFNGAAVETAAQLLYEIEIEEDNS